jgi:phosphatidylglycerophosphate synthase
MSGVPLIFTSGALLHPLAAALITAALLVIGIAAVVLLASRIRRAWRRYRERRERRGSARVPVTQ